MATKARQQYFADETSLQKQSREFSIADEIQQKIDSVEEGAQVNKIDTIKVNGSALVPDVTKAVNVEVPDVIDNLYTIAADDALSAKQGKILYDYIQNLQTIGRFLSNWDSATGLPITNPSESPYLYKAGDYYRVSNVAVSPASNYKPDGSSYTIGVASTAVETLSVAVSDLYLYDGTDWILLSNSGSGIAVDSSLSTTSTNPVENRVITNALNGKHPGVISNVAPSNPVEGMLWYDTANNELKTYDGTAWQTEGTKMVVLEYGVSTWQDFIDAYNENAIVYCRVSSGSSGYRMAFMAYTAGQGTPTEVEFQYYRSRSSHSQSSTQLDEVYVYKLTNAGVWTTTQRDTGAEMIAGTGIGITFNSSGATIYNSGVTSVNGNTGTVTLDADDISDSTTTNKFVTASDKTTWGNKQDALTLPANPTNGNLVTRGADNETLVDGGAVPVVPTNVSAFSNDAGYITANYHDSSKQDALVSGTNIKTVNNNSLLGSGDVTLNDVKVSSTAPSSPTEGMVWYDTTNSAMKVWGGTAWQSVGTGGGGSDIEYVTQAEYNALLPGALTDNKHYFIYSTSGGGGWQPGVNTIAYYPLDTDFNDASGNSRNLTNTNATITTQGGVNCAYFNGNSYAEYNGYSLSNTGRTVSGWCYIPNDNTAKAFIHISNYTTQYSIGSLGGNFGGTTFNVSDWDANYNNGTFTPNQWFLLTITQAGASEILYINGVQVSTKSDYPSEGSVPDGWCLGAKFWSSHSEKLTGYLSNIILEDKERTAQEVSDYYDLTKGDYGIGDGGRQPGEQPD